VCMFVFCVCVCLCFDVADLEAAHQVIERERECVSVSVFVSCVLMWKRWRLHSSSTCVWQRESVCTYVCVC